MITKTRHSLTKKQNVENVQQHPHIKLAVNQYIYSCEIYHMRDRRNDQ